MRIHDLRHSAVAILLAQGVNARSICEMLGHSSVALHASGVRTFDGRDQTRDRRPHGCGLGSLRGSLR
jgi:integrase